MHNSTDWGKHLSLTLKVGNDGSPSFLSQKGVGNQEASVLTQRSATSIIFIKFAGGCQEQASQAKRKLQIWYGSFQVLGTSSSWATRRVDNQRFLLSSVMLDVPIVGSSTTSTFIFSRRSIMQEIVLDTQTRGRVIMSKKVIVMEKEGCIQRDITLYA